MQEATASLAAAEEISVICGSFTRAGRRFHMKRRTKSGTEGFSRWKRCFRLTSDWIRRDFSEVEHHGESRGGSEHPVMLLAPAGSLEPLLPDSTGSSKKKKP